MPSSFIRGKPLQALKLTVVIGALVFGLSSYAGVLPGGGLNGLLYFAFFPVILAVVVVSEALYTGYRLIRTDDPVARLTARRAYTVIRAIELIVAVVAPTIFYVLIVQLGSEVAGPGAIGLLFIGVGLGLIVYGSLLLRTVTEYYYYRKRSSLSRTDEHGKHATE
ncbi:hypothetical protein [Halobellus marinus]|uniref:hypothetical protein n=1 Tax=Halobellus TaxID=1073986 RepID=UPI0028AC3A75|nr:hypothetical protein [Halobellus sp. DFY28]